MMLKHIGATALLGCLAGCSVEVSDAAENVERMTDQLYADASRLYMPEGDSNITHVYPCWMNSTQDDATERGWVEAIVNAQWSDNSKLKFTWGSQWNNDCNGASIPIEDADVQPNYDYIQDSITFNFEQWAKWSTGKGCATRRNCIEVIAVHEVGHALGFAHDFQHTSVTCPDGNVWSDPAIAEFNGDLRQGSIDPGSIMGGCVTGPALSAGDIAGLRALYGGGANIPSGASVAIRNANKKYWKYSSAAFSTTDDYNSSSRWVITNQNGGSLRYGDKVSVKRGSVYRCVKNGTTCPPGSPFCSPSAQTPGSVVWQQNLDSAKCYWDIIRSSSANAGGLAVNVNDPLRLYIKTTAGPGELSYEGTSEKIRFLLDT